MVLPGPIVSVAPAIDDTAIARTVDAWPIGAAVPEALRAGGIMSLAPTSASFAVDPLRALDPELRADLLLYALSTDTAPDAAVAAADVAAHGQATVGRRTATKGAAAKKGTTAKSASARKGAAAKKGATAKKGAKGTTTPLPLYKKLWRKPPGRWKVSQKVTWYGPGFYGNRTACGQKYTRYIIGVAHRTLPCGTLVQFTWGGITAVAPVIDRGPYGPRGLVFDWSAWLACRVFKPKRVENACFTRTDVKYRVVGKVNLKRWFKK